MRRESFYFVINTRGVCANFPPVVDEESLQDICGKGASLIPEEPETPQYGTREYALSRTHSIVSEEELKRGPMSEDEKNYDESIDEFIKSRTNL